MGSNPMLRSRSGAAVSDGAIAKFASAFGGPLIQPAAAEYASLRRIWNHAIDRDPELIALKTRYDPENLFRLSQNIVPGPA